MPYRWSVMRSRRLYSQRRKEPRLHSMTKLLRGYGALLDPHYA